MDFLLYYAFQWNCIEYTIRKLKPIYPTHQNFTTTQRLQRPYLEIPIVKYMFSFTAEITSIAFPAAKAIILKSLGTRWLVLNSVHKRRKSELAQENIDWLKQLALCSVPAASFPCTIDCPPCLLARRGRKRDFTACRQWQLFLAQLVKRSTYW